MKCPIQILRATDVTILFAGDSPFWSFGGGVDRGDGRDDGALNDTKDGYGRRNNNNELLAKMQPGTTNLLRYGNGLVARAVRVARAHHQYLSDQDLATYLKERGCIRARTNTARGWIFPPLAKLRAEWERRFGRWAWDMLDLADWL
jgi:hypothetical protein